MQATLPRKENYAQRALAETRQLRREREERERNQALQQQNRTLQATAQQAQLGREFTADQAVLGREFTADQAKLGREFTADQAKLGRKDAAEARAFLAFTEGRLSPEQASIAGTYRPEFGYRFKDIGPLNPATGKGGRQGGLPKPPDMMKTRNDLFQQFYDKGRGGSVLRKQYDGDFDKYMADVVGQYGQTPAQQAGSLPAAQTGDPSHGTITGRGGVLAGSRGGQRVDPEQYAQSLLPNAPAKAQQQNIEQPTGRVQVALPRVEDIDYEIPKMVTAADTAFRRPPSFDKFKKMQAKEQEQEITEAFRRPPTLAEFRRKQPPQKRLYSYTRRAPALPNQEIIRSQRLWGTRGESY
jgi:hypothetical protein